MPNSSCIFIPKHSIRFLKEVFCVVLQLKFIIYSERQGIALVVNKFITLNIVLTLQGLEMGKGGFSLAHSSSSYHRIFFG